jgi:predicted tellurium resistance membrane protein TerC
MLELVSDPQAWAALITLTVLEIVLGIDNLVFISVMVSRCPPAQAVRARRIGLSLALIFRLLLLFTLTSLMALREPIIEIWGTSISWRDIILIGGGLFLLAKATHEIHREIEPAGTKAIARKPQAFCWVVVQDHHRSGVFSRFHHHCDRHGRGTSKSWSPLWSSP